jgi:hypothetical protein
MGAFRRFGVFNGHSKHEVADCQLLKREPCILYCSG